MAQDSLPYSSVLMTHALYPMTLVVIVRCLFSHTRFVSLAKFVDALPMRLLISVSSESVSFVVRLEGHLAPVW